MQFCWSKREALLSIAVLGLVAFLALCFPGPLLQLALTVGLFVPTFASCTLFAWLCRHRASAFLISALGGCVGWLLAPSVEVVREFPTSYDWYTDNLCAWAILPPIGSAVAGLVVWMVEFATRRSQK
jgi:hypothetical protein